MTDTDYIMAIGHLSLLTYSLPSKYHEPLEELQSQLMEDYYKRYEVRP